MNDSWRVATQKAELQQLKEMTATAVRNALEQQRLAQEQQRLAKELVAMAAHKIPEQRRLLMVLTEVAAQKALEQQRLLQELAAAAGQTALEGVWGIVGETQKALEQQRQALKEATKAVHLLLERRMETELTVKDALGDLLSVRQAHLPTAARFVLILLSRRRRDDVLNDLCDWAEQDGRFNAKCWLRLTSALLWQVRDVLYIVGKLRGAK
jgi:hypothetical protein